MKEITIDFTSCKSGKDLHTELKNKLELPNFYGENADALWDCLTGFCETPMRVYIKKSKLELVDVQYPMGLILEVFEDFQKEEPESEVIIME
ncbi:MAG: barnase inhibitor [Ruminococcaceae bacterium]|nr:barnase inhibitor [Oscillospiraceae bacterium]